MMEPKRITPITTAGCFAAILLILAVLSRYVPFFSYVGYFIMPIPVTIIYMKFGLRQAVMLGIVVSILMSVFIDPLSAVIQMITFSSVGLALGAGFQRNWPPVKMLGLVTAALIGASILLMGAMYALMDLNVFTMLDSAFDMVSEQAIEQYKNSGMSDVQLAETKMQLQEMRRLLPSMLPCSCVWPWLSLLISM